MPDATTNRPVRISPALIGAGALVVVLGFGLPALISRPQAPQQPDPQTQQPAPQAPARAEAFAPRGGTPPPPIAPENITGALVRLVVSLAGVCGTCVLVVRYMGKKKANAPDPTMTVVASLTVGRCAVHLVRAGERRILIGTDAGGVKALVELPGAEPVPNALPADAPAARPA